MKLLGGSRFTRYDQRHLSTLNLFLDELEPKLAHFLRHLVLVSTPDVHYAAPMSTEEAASVTPSGTTHRTAPSSSSTISAPLQIHTATSAAAHQRSGSNAPVKRKRSRANIRITPIAIVCNDLFALHRILRLAYGNPSDATTEASDAAQKGSVRIRRRLHEVLVKLGPVPRMLSDGRNDYVIVDLGMMLAFVAYVRLR